MDLEFIIKNQSLFLNGSDEGIVNLSENYLNLNFTFETNDWTDLTKFALFKHDGKTTRIALVDDSCVLPASLLKKDKVVFSVYGVKGEDDDYVRVTTNLVRFNLDYSGYTSDTDDPLPDDPDLVEEIFIAISGKADSVHTHIKSDITDFSHTHSKSEITDFEHNHDDRYYTESETDELLLDKSNVGHKHNKEDISDFPVNVSAFNNDVGYLTEHQSLTNYYTREEVDAIVTGLENKILLSVSSDVIQTGTDLSLKYYLKVDGFGIEGLKVDIEKKGVNEMSWSKIGEVVTNENGVAEYIYTGSGDGKIMFRGKCQGLVSQPITVMDCVKIYSATTDFYQGTGSDLSLNNGVFSKTTGNVYPLDTSPTPTRFWTVPRTIEFDIVNTGTLAIQIGESSNVFNKRPSNMGATNGSHVKIVYDGTKITPFIDGVEKTSDAVDFTHTTNYYINFYNTGSWKNLVMY